MAEDTTRTVAGLEAPPAGHYVIDASHSVVEFVVRHLGLAKVRGRFNEFEGAIDVPEDVSAATARASIKAATIDTRNSDRDAHLRSGDFLDSDNHPTLDFRSTGVRQDNGSWLLDGELTIVGLTRPVTFAVEYEGSARDPWGGTRVGFSATTTVNREDFGLTWNQALETGGWLVGKDITIELSVEGVKQD